MNEQYKNNNNLKMDFTEKEYLLESKLLPPSRHPVLIRRNATWDKESEEIESLRVKEVLESMGIPENYNHGISI